MASILRKLNLVIWKNLIIRKRHWILTILEIVIPTLLFVLCAAVRSNIGESESNEKPESYFPVWTEEYLAKPKGQLYQDNVFLFAPNNSFVTEMVTEVAKALERKDIIGFETEEDLIGYYSALNDTDTYAIVFENLPKTGIPDHLQYKIRLSRFSISTSLIFNEFQLKGPGYSGHLYAESGFLSIQYFLDKAFIKKQGIRPETYNLTLQQFPYPAFVEENFVDTFSYILPLFTVLSYILLCPTIARVVEEKHSGVKELMKMMGLKTWMLWTGWMINGLLVCLVSVTVITILLKVPFGTVGVLHYCNPIVLWLFLMFYCAAGITFCFAVSSLFSRPILAMCGGIVLWLLSYAMTFSLILETGYVPVGVKILSALLPNTAIGWAYRLMIAYESKYVSVTWNNLFTPPSGMKGDLSIGILWIMLIVDMILYSIITWYIDSIKPGQYGIARPWYFIFQPSYWRRGRVDDLMFSDVDEATLNKKFEKPPANHTVGIKIQNLHKVFQSIGGLNKKIAVDGVTLDIYNGEITALLGHNGAGKTTTMSILTGLFSATSGSVHIDGYDIHTQLEKVRESLGLCPQHNLLFTELTVMEHLIFFAMLKGSSKQDADRKARELIGKLNLTEKANKLASTLSGGMKRRLALGIALIGNTKVLMLDEPTSGLDPEARREIWDILLGMRGERTILITTHFMEEADVLGDRIAIMDHGRVQCYGTSLFLKKLYGTGYQLNLLKKEGCIVENVSEAIKMQIPEVELKSEMGSALTYTLPSKKTANFPELFDVLEKGKERLKISSIGVSITTMEEVFLKVGKEAEVEHDGPATSEASVEYVKLNGSNEALTFKRSVGMNLFCQQVTAFFMKRITFTIRKWFAFLYQAFFPILMVILTMKLSADSGSSSEPPRVFKLRDYGQTEVLYSVSDIHVEDWSKPYLDLVKGEVSNPKRVSSVSQELLQVGNTSIQYYHDKYIVAAEFNSTSDIPVLNGMFSSTALHSVPISLNLMTNSILKAKGKSITASNHPLSKEMALGFDIIKRKVIIGILWVVLMPFGLLFFTGNFLTFPLTERVSKAKQLQLMTGTSPIAYWFTIFLWDLFQYMIVAIIMIFIILCADPLAIFSGSTELGVFTLLMIMYGLSAIPFAYFFSYSRNTSSGAFALMVILSLLVGLIMTIVVYVMSLSKDYKPTASALKYIFELIPQFTITYGFLRYSGHVITNNECKFQKSVCNTAQSRLFSRCCTPGCIDGSDCPESQKPYLAFASDDNPDAIGCELLYLALDIFLYFTLVFLIEYGIMSALFEIIKKAVNNLISQYFPRKDEGNQLLDDDVIKEQDRVDGRVKVSTHQQYEDIMLVHNLTKNYTRTFRAVKGISFGVAPGECFGLLGVNGAGKTTTFQMLTGDEIPTDGEAWINKLSLRNDKFKFLAQIGYCPQFDAINESLTGYEMLKLFANLRGVPKTNIEHEVNKWLSLLGLREYQHRQCGTYSGGNKRKLSTAMALIGDPPIVFLDEPTSGVDPVARRNLWTVLTTIQKSGQSVVLTSHSMEECEALCNRLAIMVKGQFMCMGGIQYLKQKFGQGFTIMIKLRVTGSEEQMVNRLKEEIERNFICNLKDEHQGLLHYHVTDPNTPWKQLFTTMELMKLEYSIVEDYTISETTLEQVFLSFAKVQPEEVAGLTQVIHA